MKVLHIINDYNFTKVHMNLCRYLDNYVEQIVFVPLRNEKNKGLNHFKFDNKNSAYLYSNKLNKSHRILFRSKISFLYKSLKEQVQLNDNIDVVHASTLFSDGAIALKIYKEFGIPYIVAVRNTDIFTFLKYRKDLLFLGIEIIKNASKIIFISESNYKMFSKTLLFKMLGAISKKVVINNGINDYWLDNKSVYKSSTKEKGNKFLYIGRFDSNKNVLSLISAFKKFNLTSNYENKLILVGGGGDQEFGVKELVDGKNIIYEGYINDVSILKDIMSDVDFFCMCSHTETFGLVYIEALSQGLPVLYTKDQGIDYAFTNLLIGKAVSSKSIDSIYEGLIYLSVNDFSDINNINFDDFYWKNIVRKYIEIYKEIV